MTKHYSILLRLTLTITMLMPMLAKAQLGTLFTSNQKLSSSYVKHVYQDKLGFIWVSTEDGLNRYDGYSFLTFNAEDGLGCDNINCTFEDKNQNLYAGTTSGLYVKIKGKFNLLKIKSTGEEFHAFINDIICEPNGNIIVSTSGRGLWRIVNVDEVENIIPGQGNAQFITDMLIDNKGTLWIVSDNKGVLSYKNIGTKDNIKYKQSGFYFIKNDFSHAVICNDKNGNIYCGAITGGVYVLRPSAVGCSVVGGSCLSKGNGVTTNIQHPTPTTQHFILIPSTESIPITSMLTRRDNLLFLGTNGAGLKVLNPITGFLTDSYISSPQVNLKKAKVYSIFEDRNKNVWLGLLQKGVYMTSPRSDVFNCLGEKQGPANAIGSCCIQSVYRQKNGVLWVSGDQDGLYALDKNLHQIHHYESSIPGVGVPATTLTIDEDINGRLWIGSYTEGCGWLDIATGTYHRMPFSYGKSQSVFDIRHDNKGRVWFGTLGDGLKCYDTKTEKLTNFPADDIDHKLANAYIIQMNMSSDFKKLFIGTSTGLCCLDISDERLMANGKCWTNTFGTNVIFEGDAINAILHDGKNTLWVGNSKGLFKYNLKTRKVVRQYTTEDGLSDIHICALELAKNGDLWISTNNGMCRLNTSTDHIDKYYASDGLQGNEYCPGVSFFDKTSNLMFFGGTSGVSYINPSKVKTANKDINVVITGIQMSGVRVKSFMKSGSYEICDEAISTGDEFNFCHEDNTITISFSTLSYSALDHIAFSYSINGDEWITLPAGQNNITLSRMAPGDYKFRVVAIDNGVRSKEKVFTITIHNPWYFTPLARIVYLLIIILAVWWYVREQKKRNQEQLRLQEHIHKEELNEQKLRFFINISHEIRTPMTLIVAPLLQLLKEDPDSHHHATYEIMKRNAERILHLINQILDLRKIDKGQMLMQMRETDIVTFTKDVISLFQPQATNKHISLRLIAQNYNLSTDYQLSTLNSKLSTLNSKLLVWIDRSQFDKVVMNLLSNAMKYTPNGGKVEVRLENIDDQQLKLTVYNNGSNIPEESLNRIFERFYQSASLENQGKIGTGVGLDLTRSIVLLHHGTITAQNVDDGVEFIVTIPLGNKHLRPEEIANVNDDDDDNVNDNTADLLALTETPKEGDEEKILIEEPAPIPTSKRPTIAIVEDDDEIRNYLMTELSPVYRVLTFTDGSEALPAILREIPQLIVSDVMMPNMDGNTLCAKVKANVNTNHIPVILLTAKTRDDDKLEGLESGADLYVTKPFNMDILRRSIANLLGTRKLMQNKFTGKEDQKEQIDNVELESVDERLLNRIMAVINANINNSDLNIDMICTEVGISRVHLHRKMKELTNQTPHDFIRNLRLKQAARLLARGGQSITEVMYHCGFNSPTSFSTMFKKMYGVSPREYMNQQKNQ